MTAANICLASFFLSFTPSSEQVSSSAELDQYVSKCSIAVELDPLRTRCNIDDLRKILYGISH